ncbi:putative hemolysin [Jatrophihabitans sp. GAS493]|uniref:hemolysin family protein n=1 Tax=Jatrophihabitans sp. GAS493 TaxID=1907575 RepID=UPI000BB6D4AF|nr:hemolysin family protein [Jatrophihabitans sp. GAS493]SOD71952.1 putative hemolysin [Jatrophihabitans sp. GAS493]
MNSSILNVGIVIGLILIEGVFVAAEIALVSLREGQVRAMAETSRRGAAVAKLVRDPNRFLAAVQIGVTSTALLSSAFGAVTLSDEAKDFLLQHGWSEGLAGATGIIGVTLIISFVTLVVGELAPKRLGLQRAEAAAQLFAPALSRMASLLRPVIWLLSKCTDGLVRLLGGDPNTGREAISEEELRDLVSVHESLTKDERRLIDEVFAAGERSLSEVMVPRTEVTFLESSQTVSRAAKLAFDSPHSRYPVIGASQDDVRGFVHIRDLLTGEARADHGRTVGDVLREVKQLPGSKNVLVALSEMRREGHHLAIVVDEYGGTDGIVTLEDLIEEVIGDIRDEYDEAEAGTTRMLGGVVEIDGRVNLNEFTESTGLKLAEGPYETAAGYVMAALGRLPAVGDSVEADGHRLLVTEVDGRRAARIQVTPPEPAEPAE